MSPELREFGHALKIEPHGVGMLFVTVGLEILVTLALPWPLKLLVDNLLEAEPLPSALAWLATPGTSPDFLGTTLVLSAALLTLFFAQALLALFRAFVTAGVGARMRTALAARVLQHLQRLDLGFHSGARVGDLTQRVTMDARFTADLLGSVLIPGVTALGTLLAMLWVLLLLSPQLTLVALLASLPIPLLVRHFKPVIAERTYRQQQSFGTLMSVAEQSMTSVQVIQAFGGEAESNRRFRSQSDDAIDAVLSTTRAELRFNLAIGTLQAVGTGAAVIVGGYLVLQGAASVGTLLVALAYLKSVFAPVYTLAGISTEYGRAMGQGRRVSELFQTEPTVRQSPNACPLPPAAPNGRAIAFERVSYGYRNRPAVLENIDLEIRPGETVALVGETGSGKSTLAALLMRLVDPEKGRVLFDGHDLREVTLESVNASLSVVLQDPYLLPLSVAENIALGRPDACEQDIRRAAATAQADAFIRRLPQGYDTVLAERGATLSGGQRQRLAIARALLRDAPVVIFDEPSSALDAVTETALFNALDHWRRQRTVLLIAHRPATLRIADRVLELRRGELRERLGNPPAWVAQT